MPTGATTRYLRGETPSRHASAINPGAIRLYESPGFRARRQTVFGRS